MIRLPHFIAPRGRFGLGLLCCITLASAPVQAAPPQVADDDDAPASVSHPVVEPTGPGAGTLAGKSLNAALVQLARDPRNVDALTAAGNAASAMGDNEAALGFFTRANQVAPTNATVKSAIAGVRLHLDDPVEALRWYAEAEAGGADPAGFALDRGLAYDLVGDNGAAIAQYRTVLAHTTDAALRDEATRREAMSLAILGDRRAADAALLPLLQRQDRAAWRTHILALAVAGRSDEAIAVARATMPPDLAEAIAPYLRFMARLTPAQQAAVASLGRFPRAADVGRDDARIAAYVLAHPRVPLAPAATAQAAPLAVATVEDPKAARARRRRGHDTATVAPAVTAPPPEPELALPAPPPPPVAIVPAPSATPSSPGAPGVPRPAVLSLLDMPPLVRHKAATATIPAMSDAPNDPSTTAAAPARPATGPASVMKPDKAETGSNSARDRRARAKSAHDKADKEEAQATVLGPCKPAAKAKTTAKGRKGKAAAAREDRLQNDRHHKDRHHAAATRTRRGGKAGHGDQTSETCAKSPRGERPDGPVGVARDSQTEPAPKTKEAKAKDAKAREDKAKDDKTRDDKTSEPKGKDAKGKRHDRNADHDIDKSGEKTPRHARYASRIWVEVLTGADRDRMPGEWRTLLRKAHKLKGRKPFITPWHSNFRLLTGPFDSDADAQDFIAELRKEGVSGFEWTSPAGQAVDSLAVP